LIVYLNSNYFKIKVKFSPYLADKYTVKVDTQLDAGKIQRRLPVKSTDKKTINEEKEK